MTQGWSEIEIYHQPKNERMCYELNINYRFINIIQTAFRLSNTLTLNPVDEQICPRVLTP